MDSMDLFSGLSDVYSETWPISGTTRAGRAYARPMWVHLTAASESSSSPGLLPTPSVADGTGGHMTRGGARSNELLLGGIAAQLLPTPRTTDGNGAGHHGQGGMDLRTTVTLLPTPKATDGTKGGPNQRGSSGDLTMPSVVHQLLPTPTAMDSAGSRNCTARRGPNAKAVATGTTLTDWLWLREGWTGEPTETPSDGGSD